MHDLRTELRSLLAATRRACAPAEEAALDQSVARRLRESVVRPLNQALGLPPADESAPADGGAPAVSASTPEVPAPDGTPRDQVWALAKRATELHVVFPDVAELGEATAALQDLSATLADEGVGDDRLAQLAVIQSSLGPRIQVATSGPYLVTNVAALYDWLGQPLAVRPKMALCRCGASATKPFCDGAHAGTGFSDGKGPNRVADRHDTYVGQQVTVLDNRGTCQHSGFCTDRLSTVFHQGDGPFVTPSGGRMDEIIRAVRDCPSGALSYAIDGVEARGGVDYHSKRAPAVEVSKDGPYRVTGAVPVVDGQGHDVVRNQGASLEHFALCRCGRSQNKPFCSGMHWYVKFSDPVKDLDQEPTIFEWAGGLPALTRMTRLFYEKYVPEDPLLAPLFATMSADHPQRVAKWLAEVFCGPALYSAEHGGYPRMLSQHLGKGLSEEQRARWVALLLRSAADAGLPNDAEFRSAFGSYIEWGSRLAVENSQSGATPPPHMPIPRWDWHTAAGPPGSRISPLAPPTQQGEKEIVLPADDDAVSFEAHIKQLFRPSDKQSMSFAFDLWSYDDVSRHASAILGRLRAGTMPCDGSWPAERVELFERWVGTGKAP